MRHVIMSENMKFTRIAILGATSHIARGLIYHFSSTPWASLFLFARSPERVGSFIAEHGLMSPEEIFDGFESFHLREYDVIINCVGLGSPPKIKNRKNEFFRLTEHYDNMVMDYLDKHPAALYLNMSSGAVYGTDFSQPAEHDRNAILPVNRISADHFYSIAKINAEAKHRAHPEKNIVDLRVFTYFSRYIDIESGYLITEIVKSARDKRKFLTGKSDIIRDIVGPADLFSLVCLCIGQRTINTSFDVYSAGTARKFEILDFFQNCYGLEYVVDENFSTIDSIGLTLNYYSTDTRAKEIGYVPQYSSLGVIEEEVTSILFGEGGGAEKRHES